MFDGKEILYWPSHHRIAETSVGELEEKCKLGYRAERLRAIAETVREGFPSFRELEKMSSEEANATLTKLKGISDYSADIVSLYITRVTLLTCGVPRYSMCYSLGRRRNRLAESSRS